VVGKAVGWFGVRLSKLEHRGALEDFFWEVGNG